MEEQSLPSPSSDERLMAALSYLLGLFGALIIWAIQKDKSRYVRFQAVQAMAYYFCMLIVMFLLIGCGQALIFAGMFAGMYAVLNDPSSSSSLMLVFLPWLGFVFIPLSMLAWIPPIWAAVRVFQGREFRFPWLGAKIEKFLEK